MGAIEGSALAVALRESAWLYPAIEALHILGLALVVGAAIAFDLRLLGLGRALPLEPAEAFLPRLSLVAFFSLSLPTGALLFVTQARALAANPVFWAKLGLLAMAAANAWLFRRGVRRQAAIVSLIAWIGVLFCGRFLAYT
ncbi:MAG TPA: hypothetical protein VNO33_05125 [Kofleriaceae bacterium]|nr:hypothetical protein [Kofleriaceae bacterium]